MSRAVFLLLLCSCGGQDPAADDGAAAEVWPPPPPERGIQLKLDDMVVPVGGEVERCRPILTTGEAGVVTRIELYAKDGLHHAFVTKGGADVLQGEEPCYGLPDAAMEGYNVPEPLYASSTQVGRETVVFPEGVGVPIEADQDYVFNYHLLNYTGEELQAEVYLNLHFADEPDDLEPAGLYVMGNITDWTIPAGSTGRVRFSCPFPEDVEVFSLTPHMHALGTGMTVEDSQTGEVLMETGSWQAPSSTYLQPARAFEEGEGMTVTCEWANPGDEDVSYGPTSEEEMCFLFGYHWPSEGFRFLSEHTGCTLLEN